MECPQRGRWRVRTTPASIPRERRNVHRRVDDPRLRRQRNLLRGAAHTDQLAHFDTLRRIAQQRAPLLRRQAGARSNPKGRAFRGCGASRAGAPGSMTTPPPRGVQSLGIACNEGIARRRADGRVEHQLHTPARAGFELIAFEAHHVSDAVRRADVNVQRRPVRQRLAVGEPAQKSTSNRVLGASARGSASQSAARQRRLSMPASFRAHRSPARPTLVSRFLRMNAAHPHQGSGRHHGEHVSDLHTGPRARAGRSPPSRRPRQRKDTIDAQAK